ncbi:hypothetical protein SAMN05880590_107112 [Rhizobium sp. RU35A]|uniref:Uncharacterized protein n=1 Tax=Rhizobium straminoryzae TaxID=1387186 RepID=A0A549SLZ9_9HYPH|nr:MULTISPECIES: hypothetical protein [Rhizobium]TRL30653.1 hypothetical protein FNA46_25225 [Rhizobium straminoryzae]SIQ77371.1 hypothetical protein SAMN05880590_107112 [Rhizobium sp. RU35A]
MRAAAFLLSTLMGASFLLLPLVAQANEELVLENKTDGMIIRFTVRPADGKGQKVELLKKRGLAAGKSRTLVVPTDGKTCLYSIFAEFEAPDYQQGYENVSDKLDVCEVGTYTIE